MFVFFFGNIALFAHLNPCVRSGLHLCHLVGSKIQQKWKVTARESFLCDFKGAGKRDECSHVLLFACRDAALDPELGPYPFKRNQWCKQTVLCAPLLIQSRAKDKTLRNFADQSKVCACSPRTPPVAEPALHRRLIQDCAWRDTGMRGGPEEQQSRDGVRSFSMFQS